MKIWKGRVVSLVYTDKGWTIGVIKEGGEASRWVHIPLQYLTAPILGAEVIFREEEPGDREPMESSTRS